MNLAAKEIKKFKPIQSAVMKFFALKTWEETKTKFGDDVSPIQLSRFLVSISGSIDNGQPINERQI